MKIGKLFLVIMIVSILGCTSKENEKQVSLMIKTPTLSMSSISNPEIKASYDFLEYVIKKFRESDAGKNINITLELFEYVNELEAITNSYGTDYAVDILYEGYFNMSSYISGGHVVSLDDIITKEIYNDISESSWKQSRKNDKIYMMPYLSMQNILAYNKELFHSCGLEKYISEKLIIQNWTIDEWNEIFDTLAKKLPNGTYPMMMFAVNNQGDTHIMSLLRAFGSEIFDKNGNFDFENEKAIKALKWIQDGVGRGWYAPYSENLEILDNTQLFFAGRLAVCMVNNTSIAYDNDFEEKFGLVNFPNNIATSFITGFEIFDNGDKHKLAAAKKFLKFMYEDEEIMELSAGSLPESKRVAAKYADKLYMLEEFSANAKNVVDFMNSSPNWQGQENSVRSVFYKPIHELLRGTYTPEQCAAELNKVCNEAINVDVKYHE